MENKMQQQFERKVAVEDGLRAGFGVV